MDAPAVENASAGGSAFRSGLVQGGIKMPDSTKPPSKSFFLYVVGLGILLAGLILILRWWNSVVIVFEGGAGIVIAITGLVILMLAKE